ncbi:16922_t:CDS:2 [Funneliformis caledonium]|uniref:16922_t:CDS:1 n=1 Tax=Funneliformis caledonium TaxID=1117310 RepID=A0A9N9D7V2_9GLOM|nr:16922_t:CDS:2 [Funneliformis caledonium]
MDYTVRDLSKNTMCHLIFTKVTPAKFPPIIMESLRVRPDSYKSLRIHGISIRRNINMRNTGTW